ncbi:MAG: hypothetical protein DMF91_27375 [Acidobacteria bacterium]|nr:MAG: hypothetical protein DMF91_27375 [Acidobacteriota bacterium]
MPADPGVEHGDHRPSAVDALRPDLIALNQRDGRFQRGSDDRIAQDPYDVRGSILQRRQPGGRDFERDVGAGPKSAGHAVFARRQPCQQPGASPVHLIARQFDDDAHASAAGHAVAHLLRNLRAACRRRPRRRLTTCRYDEARRRQGERQRQDGARSDRPDCHTVDTVSEARERQEGAARC